MGVLARWSRVDPNRLARNPTAPQLSDSVQPRHQRGRPRSRPGSSPRVQAIQPHRPRRAALAFGCAAMVDLHAAKHANRVFDHARPGAKAGADLRWVEPAGGVFERSLGSEAGNLSRVGEAADRGPTRRTLAALAGIRSGSRRPDHVRGLRAYR